MLFARLAWLLDSDIAATSIHRLSEMALVPDKDSIKPCLLAAARRNRVRWLMGWQIASDLPTSPTRSPAGRWCFAWKETGHCGGGGELPMTCRMCKAVTNPRRQFWLDSLIWLWPKALRLYVPGLSGPVVYPPRIEACGQRCG